MNRIVLLSGGVDSTVLLAQKKKDARPDEIVHAVSFDYGQRHVRELEAAEAIAKQLEVVHSVYPIPALRTIGGSSQTSFEFPVPHGHYTDETMKTTVVPNRNMIMLSIAIAKAVTFEGNGAIYFAAHAGDHPIYPDCRPRFQFLMHSVSLEATDGRVNVLAPFINVSKADIVHRGAELDAPFHLTYSCYEGDVQHCGQCGTCVERKEAFKEAGVPDPTSYKA